VKKRAFSSPTPTLEATGIISFIGAAASVSASRGSIGARV
jgi:hypothetical protein